MGRAESRLREPHGRLSFGRRPAAPAHPSSSPPASRFRPFRLARRWGAAACVLAAAFVLLLGTGAAQAQTPTSEKLVGNTGIETSFNFADFTRDQAQAFTTGGSLYGYKLTRVDLRIRDLLAVGATRPTYSVSIQRPRGTVLGTLTNPDSLSTSGLPQFTHATGIDLDPNTTYWVVIDVTANPSASIDVFRIRANDEDPGAEAGWSIADDSFARKWNSTGSWGGSAFSAHLAIHGYARNLPLIGHSLTIRLDRAIDPGKCPSPDAFTLTAHGVEQPSPFVYLRCKPRSLELRLSRYVNERGNIRLRPPIPTGLPVEVRYDKSEAIVCDPDGECIGGKLTYADDGSEVANFTTAVDNETPGPVVGPDYAGASVSGRTLTVTFDGPLDEGSAPAGDAFRVTTLHGGGHGLRRCAGGCRVAVTDVSVSGDTAVLTLAEAIPGHAGSASVVYEAPSDNPLRGASDSPKSAAVESFAEWRLPVLTPDTAPVFSSASVRGTKLSIDFNELMDEGSAPAGSAFTVRAKRDGRTRTIRGTGTARVGTWTSVTLASAVAAGETVTLSYEKPTANPLRDRGGTELESFSGMPVTNGQPRIQSVEIVSEPQGGDGDTYGSGGTVRVQVTFDVPVIVSTRGGTPRLKLDLAPGRNDEKWAAYESGTRTDTLTFAWRVGASSTSAAGIAVPANAIDLNGGKIIAFSSYGRPAVEADLAHARLARDPDHKVDSRIVTLPEDGIYWSATLTVGSGAGLLGCDFHSLIPCSTRLTSDTFTHGVETYEFESISFYRDSASHPWRVIVALDKAWPETLRDTASLHVGGVGLSLSAASYSHGGISANWSGTSVSGISENATVSVSLRDRSYTPPADPPDTTPPAFQRASVNGASLTLTFDEDLDAGSVPAPADFYVTVAGSRRSVAAGGVAIDGAAVTLTLESAVAHGEEVTVRYSKGANPLRDEAGNEVAGFAFTDKTATNITPPAGAFWSATLTVKWFGGGSIRGCSDALSIDCSGALTDDSFTHAGISYEVVGAGSLPHLGSTTPPELLFVLDKAIPTDWTLHVGDQSFPLANATLSSGDTTATWSSADLNWQEGSKVPLWLSAPAGPSIQSGPPGDEGPAFQSASVSGTELTVTFDEALDEDSAPAGSSFTVTATPSGGAARTLTGTGTAGVSGATVTVTLDGTVSSGETLTVSYEAPDTNPLRNAAGHDVADFSGQPASYRTRQQASRPPGAPTGVTVAGASASSLSVSWTAPADTGTWPISGYELRYYAGASDPADDSAWTGTGDVGTDTSTTIAGLTADTAYRVQVRARGAGKGPWSASGTGRTEAGGAIGQSGNDRPPAPRSATVDGRAVTVTFDRPLVTVGEGEYLHFDLTVTGAGVEQHPVRASASGREVTATLGSGSPARAGKSYTIGYYGGGQLKGVNGAEVAAFSGLAAENLTLPVLRVADAKATEGTDATLDFVVSMNEAMPEAVTVDYATADGTATAGADYTATSGTLTFAAGERRKTIAVAILDDAVDEGNETFLLRLSNAQGARIGDGEATGTIENDDPLQKMLLSRIGRTVAGHLTDAVSDRLSSPLDGAQVTVAGQRVDLAQAKDGAALAQALTGLARVLGAREAPGPEGGAASGAWPGERGAGWNDTATTTAPRSMTGRELLLGSAFHLAREGDGAGPGLAAWGRVTVGGFDGREAAETGDVRIDGEVSTGILGADAQWERLLAGVAVSLSDGEGTFDQPGVDSGEFKSTLTTVSPYARLGLTDRVSAWGLAGFGTGDMTITQAANDRGQPERVTRTDIEMRLAAAGGRGALMQADETGGMDLALRADAFYVETEAEPVSNEGSTTGVASRVRLGLEGSRAFQIGEGAVLTPGLEVGLRHDGGDAETGTGVELGGRVSYADAGTGLSMEARVRALIAHEDSDYKEWGASGSVRLDPGDRGRGLSFTLAPAYGAASSGMDRLWSARDARGLAPGREFEPESRLEGELGYGLALFGGGFTGTPNVGFGLSDASREWRLGWRLTSAVPGDPGFELNLDATRREAANDPGPGSGADAPVEHGVRLELRAWF